MDARAETAAVVQHPAVRELGRDALEQAQVDTLAWDLAAWLAGAPRESLTPLARVVTAVGGRALRDARVLCEGLPLLAVEAGARATAALWPLLRALRPPDDEPAPEDAPPEPDPPGEPGAPSAGEASAPGAQANGAGATRSAESAASDVGDAGAPAEHAADAPLDEEAPPDDALARLADLERGDDPKLDALGQQPGAVDAVRDAVGAAGEAAWRGAREGEQAARLIAGMLPGMGWGARPGTLQRALLRHLEPWSHLVGGLPALRELADRLGRVESSDRRRQHDQGGSEEVHGIRQSGDVARALPAELALLSDEATEDLFYQRYAEHRLLTLELRGAGLDGVAEPGRRGPVICAVDTSGSMRGAPGVLAKAVVLAVARKVLPQGRAVHVLLFGGAGEQKELRLRRGSLEDLLELLGWGFGGGTDFDAPLLRALELLRERQLARADVLIVTDGYARVAPDVEAEVRRAREAEGVRVFGCVVAGNADALRHVADELWAVEVEGGVIDLVRALRAREGGPG